MRTKFTFLFFALTVLFGDLALAQTQMMGLPNQNNIYSGFTRGFWFTAPADFTIVGLKVSQDGSPAPSGDANIALLEFTNGTGPTAYPTTTNLFNTLYVTQNNTNTGIIPVNIPIATGDILGVLGSNSNQNSYGTPGAYATTIDGQPCTLERMGMQYQLQNTLPQDLWKESSGSISRVEIWYVTCDAPTPQLMSIGHIDCHGDSTGTASANATGGIPPYTFIWNNTDTLTTITNLPAGTHTLKILDDIDCLADTTFDIVEPDTVSTTTSGTNLSCYMDGTGTTTVAATGGTPPYSYDWDNGSGTAATHTNLQAGWHNVAVTDSLGCTVEDSVKITEPDSLYAAVDSIHNVTCDGDDDGMVITHAEGGTGPFTFLWSDNQVTSTAVALTQGFYGVTITDINNCDANEQVQVDYNHDLPVINMSNVNTTSSFADLDAPGGYASYEWSNGSNASSIRVFKSGDYTVTVTDDNGCSSSETVSVTLWATGIGELNNTVAVSLFPNPTNGVLNISPEGLNNEDLMIEVLNLNGQVLQAEKIESAPSKLNRQYDLTGYAAGVYLVKLSSGNSTLTERIQLR